MSDILDALQKMSDRVEADSVPKGEKRPDILNLAVESNYGRYKFIPILPASVKDIPFITAKFDEIKLHVKGAKWDAWQRVIQSKYVDRDTTPPSDLEKFDKCRDILADVNKMKDPEFHKVTRGWKKVSGETIRFKTYVIWYAYIIEAKDRKGAVRTDMSGTFKLMVIPTKKMETAVNNCYKSVVDNYESELGAKILQSLYGGSPENRRDYFELTVERPQNYEITLTPMISQPGMKINIPDKLISDAGYANLKHPLSSFIGSEDGKFINMYTINNILKVLMGRMGSDEPDDKEDAPEPIVDAKQPATSFTIPDNSDANGVPF